MFTYATVRHENRLNDSNCAARPRRAILTKIASVVVFSSGKSEGYRNTSSTWTTENGGSVSLNLAPNTKRYRIDRASVFQITASKVSPQSRGLLTIGKKGVVDGLKKAVTRSESGNQHRASPLLSGNGVDHVASCSTHFFDGVQKVPG